MLSTGPELHSVPLECEARGRDCAETTTQHQQQIFQHSLATERSSDGQTDGNNS